LKAKVESALPFRVRANPVRLRSASCKGEGSKKKQDPISWRDFLLHELLLE
jgi:hypothetical protein